MMMMTLAEAAALIPNGATIALGGVTIYRRPVAFALALIRQKRHSLTLVNFTAGYESDLLVGAECVSTVRSVYFGLESFGLAPMFTQRASELTILEETEASIVMGLRAQMAGVGFMPSTAWIGTDLPRLRPDVKQVIDPYTGETLMAFPAIQIDYAILHGLEADTHGNVTLNNNLGIDLELIYAAEHVIVTVEKLVDQVCKSTDHVVIPAPGVDVIVHAPNGAYPTSCYPLYPIGGEALMQYVDACNAGEFESYLAEQLAVC
ncbi:MAG: CoA transferase subunit A [Phototrophicales bacterium]|nr:MAG: CoA transferase subunit A [Phototrophicales bacterium]RMG75202.1 MAG: CoA transferase subunit A [Chloroflexota bacterium]